jgi:hypothetical protein
MGHIPNIDSCHREFGKRLHAILDRYSNVIRWSMYSHKHKEIFNIQRSLFSQRPLSINYLVGSGTPNGGKDPSFSVIYIDPKTLLPIDFETWIFDL